MKEEQREKLKKIINRAEGNRRFTENLSATLQEATSTISHKTNGTGYFSDWEIEILRTKYEMTDEQVVDIFIRGAKLLKTY